MTGLSLTPILYCSSGTVIENMHKIIIFRSSIHILLFSKFYNASFYIFNIIKIYAFTKILWLLFNIMLVKAKKICFLIITSLKIINLVLYLRIHMYCGRETSIRFIHNMRIHLSYNVIKFHLY